MDTKSDAPVERIMDLRVMERNLRKGIITNNDVTQFEANLKDMSDNAETFTIDGDDDAATSDEAVAAEVTATPDDTAPVPSVDTTAAEVAATSAETASTTSPL